MTDQQPTALRLATVLENKLGGAADEDIEQAAAELRLLHDLSETRADVIDHMSDRIAALEQALGVAVEALDNLYNDTEVMVTHRQHTTIKQALATARQTLGGAA